MTRLLLSLLCAFALVSPAAAQQRDTTKSDSTEFQRRVRDEVQRVLQSLGLGTVRDSTRDEDSLRAPAETPHDSTRRHGETRHRGEVLIGDRVTEPKPFYEWQPFNWFRYNRVDGLFLGIGTSNPQTVNMNRLNDFTVRNDSFQANALRTNLGVGYAFGSHFWTVEGGLSWLHRFDNGSHLPTAIEIGAEGHVRTDTRDAWLVDLGENTAAALIAHEDFMDYFKRRGWSAKGSFYLGHEQLSAEYRRDEYTQLDTRQYWSLFGGRKLFRENDETLEPSQFPGVMPTMVLTSYFNNVRTNRLFRGWSLLAQAEYGVGQYKFNRYLVDLRRYQPLAKWSAINVRMRAGAVQGESVPVTVATGADSSTWHGFRTPVTEYFEIGGISTLPAYDYKQFVGNRMMLVNAEWSITGRALDEMFFFPFDDLTVMLVADAGLAYFVDDTVGVTSGWSQLSMRNLKSDVGFAVGSANGQFRVGWVWRTDQSEGGKFFIRLSRPF